MDANEITTDVVIEVEGKPCRSPFSGRVFPVEYMTSRQAERCGRRVRMLGRNVYVIHKPLDGPRQRGFFIAQIVINDIMHMKAWRNGIPLHLGELQNKTSFTIGEDELHAHVCKEVRRAHRAKVRREKLRAQKEIAQYYKSLTVAR